MSEVSKISFGGSFHFKFHSPCATMKQYEKGAKAFLNASNRVLNEEAKFFISGDGLRWGIDDRKPDIFFLKKVGNFKLNKSSINVERFDIEREQGFFKKRMGSVFTTFVVKDKKKNKIDLYSVAYDTHSGCYSQTYSERIKAFMNMFNNLVFFNNRGPSVNLFGTMSLDDFCNIKFSAIKNNKNTIAECIECEKLDSSKIYDEKSFNKAVEDIKNVIVNKFSSKK